MGSLEVAPVLVAPAPVITTLPAKHKVLDLDQDPYVPAAKSVPAAKANPAARKKLAGGYVLEDVPHLTDYLPELKIVQRKRNKRHTGINAYENREREGQLAAWTWPFERSKAPATWTRPFARSKVYFASNLQDRVLHAIKDTPVPFFPYLPPKGEEDAE